MNLSDYLNKEDVLIEAFKHPVMKVTAKRTPDIDDALKATLNAIEFGFYKNMTAIMEEKFQEVLDDMELIDGEHDDSETPGEWEQAIDQKVEDALEPYIQILSADWLGNNTIATRLHEAGGINKLASSFAREMYKQLTWGQDKSPNKILSAAGVMHAEIEARLKQHLNPTEEETLTMAKAEQDDLEAVAAKMLEHLGTEFDRLEVAGDIDLASDDDDILAGGALPRLGLDPEDRNALETARMIHGEDLADHVFSLMDGDEKPAKGKNKRAPAKKAVKKAAPVADDTGDAAAEREGAGGITSATLIALQENAGIKDQEMADGLGVSRATYNNYRSGKALFDPTDKQQGFIRDKLVSCLNALHVALAEVDSTEAHEVF